MTMLTTPEQRRRRADYRLSLPCFRCGHDRTPENTASNAGCLTCKRENSKRYQRRKRTNRRRDRRAYARKVAQRTAMPAVPPVLTSVPRTRKPWIQPTPRELALIEEARVEFNRLYGTPDSTDPAQLAADFGGEG